MNVNTALLDAWTLQHAAAFFRNMWPMYVHEISAFDTQFYSLDASGVWQPDIVEDWVAPLTPPANLRGPGPDADQPFQRAHVITSDGLPVGFVCTGTTPFRYMPEAVDHVVAEFFLIHAARGTGIADSALGHILKRYPGRWHLRAIHDNLRAIRFWGRALPEAGVRDLQEGVEDGDVTWRFTSG